MLIRQLFDENSWTYTYVLGDLERKQAVLIDPVREQLERDLRLLDELGLQLRYVLDTHVHADHVTAAGELRARTAAKTSMGSADKVACADQNLQEGDRLHFSDFEIEVRATPGHTSGCKTYIARSAAGEVYAFTGDALLIRGSGRTDFQGGDARTLYQSVHQKIFSLPDATIIYPGHDYRGHTASTVGEEKRVNPRLNLQVDEDAFVAMMANLNLPNPKLMDVAVPANLSCGLRAASQEQSA